MMIESFQRSLLSQIFDAINNRHSSQAGIHFPGMLSSDISFESLSGLNPIDQWAAVPDAGE